VNTVDVVEKLSHVCRIKKILPPSDLPSADKGPFQIRPMIEKKIGRRKRKLKGIGETKRQKMKGRRRE